MVRSIYCGNTNYSNQSLDDMIKDLEAWLSDIKKTKSDLQKKWKKIQDSGLEKRIYSDFVILLYKSIHSLETFEVEIAEILLDIKHEEIKKNHVKRLRKIGDIGSELNHEFGLIWHQGYEEHGDKRYGESWFDDVEFLYICARQQMSEMMDIISLSKRLEDFVGRKKQGSKKLKFCKSVAEWVIKIFPIFKPLLTKFF
jgi:hypothetical protein